MEEVPLKQDTEIPPVKDEDKKGSSATSSSFYNKRTFIIAAIVILVLLILVIVLGALLGAERAERARKGRRGRGDGGKESAVVATSAPAPTTPGTEVWWNVRLPDNIVPDHYDVVLYIDLKKLVFFGDVSILVNVTKPTENVLVHVNKMNITQSPTVEKASSGAPLEIQRHFWFEKNQFYVIVLTSALEKGHQYKIKMKFRAELGDGLAGLYKSTYTREDGTEVTMAATQFQPTDARRTFPCFDEPALKATFTFTLVHDPKLISIANMPIKSTEKKDGWQFDHFEKTPRMPTYLLAFVVCDFDKTTKTTGRGTKMTFYAPRDKIDQVEYAKENAVIMLDYMEEYFNITYPLPKADMVALPDFAFSGMENWGIIMYREAALLYKPNASSEANKQRTAGILSHELAHQWFGNLVTMAWWDDLWLNEGFASFVEFYGVDETEPEWKMLDQFVVIDMMLAFTLDGLANSHPIRVPVNHPDEINEIFDYISYNKGSSIIRMLQHFLGKSVFQKGLTRYLNKYRYGNAVINDLWDALEEESCAQGSCKRVKQLMDTWTLQMGYPVLTVTKKSGNTYTVSQERFLYDRNANLTSKYTSPFKYKWVVPFTYVTGAKSEPTSKLLDMTSAEIEWDGSGWLKGNAGHTGFYRVNYAQQQWNQIIKQLETDHKVFSVKDRAGLIDDAFNLARGGYLKYSVALGITKYLKNEDEYVPWAALDNNIKFVSRILPQSSPAFKYLKRYLQSQARIQYAKLGFKDSGSHLDVYKRSLILSVMCSAGEASCLKNASDYFNKWMEDPVQYPVPANLRSLVYFYGVRNGGVKEWNFLFEQFQKSSVASERQQFLFGLAGASEPWLLNRYLEYSVRPKKIRTQDTRSVILNVASHNPYGRQLTWQFIKLNWDFIMEKFGGGFYTISKIILGVTEGFASEYQLEDLISFNKNHPAGSGERAQQQAEETVKANIQWRQDHEQDIGNWLKDFLQANNIPYN